MSYPDRGINRLQSFRLWYTVYITGWNQGALKIAIPNPRRGIIRLIHSLSLLQSGAVHSVLIAAALGFMVLAILIWVMEFSGWTISRRGYVPNNMSWDSTNIALIAISAALYIAGRPIQFQLIPGIGGVNPTLSLAPVFAVLFGLPGAIGVVFSMPIGDALSGALTLGSVAGCLSHTYITWFPYKMC